MSCLSESSEPKLDAYTDNNIINNLIDDIESRFPGRVREIEYNKWPHVPHLGKRLWLSADDIGDTWDLTDLIDKYHAQQLMITVTPHPHLNDFGEECGTDLYMSTMWTTKGHKERKF